MANGILVIDKGEGLTSHDVVAKVRRLLREKRVGHAGTLDPMATGVLPVFVGRATRAVEFAAEGSKEYLVGLRLGITTDTQDTTGRVLNTRDVSITREQVEEALKGFRGDILQVPPMYSALKRDGKKLYELARAGIEVEREARPVTIHALEMLSAEKDYLLRISCSKGTYMRTLCHDLGEALGCGGVMCSLRRTCAAGFSLKTAVTLEQLSEAAERGEGEQLLTPVDRYFAERDAITVDANAEKRLKNGVTIPCKVEEGTYRVYSPTGEFLLLGRIERGLLHTVKSFFEV